METNRTQKLNSWKEIAAYLRCQERTARRWEKERALPVHRPPGDKRSSVFAFPDELDRWLGSHRDGWPAEETTRRVNRRVLLGGVAGAAAAAGAGAAWFLRRRAGNPVRVTIAGQTLFAWDERGRVAWEHSFPERLSELPPDERARLQAVAVDLDGDGSNEVLYAAAFPEAQTATCPPCRWELLCFSSRGKLLWQYKPEVALTFGDTRFADPWRFSDLLTTPAAHGRTIWLAVAHVTWRPSFLMKISPGGAAGLQFVNAGAIYRVGHIPGTSGGQVLVGGINNEYAAASLAVLNEHGAPARSPQTPGSRFECVDGPKGVPDLYFLLPPCEVCRYQRPYNSVWNISVTDRRVIVETAEGVDVQGIYEFSEALQPQSVTYSDGYALWHRRYEVEGRLNHGLDDCPQLKNPVRVRRWDPGSGWTTVEVPPTKGVKPDSWRP